jgi:hypothetical protein
MKVEDFGQLGFPCRYSITPIDISYFRITFCSVCRAALDKLFHIFLHYFPIPVLTPRQKEKYRLLLKHLLHGIILVLIGEDILLLRHDELRCAEKYDM